VSDSIVGKIWIITAPWYDKRGYFAWEGPTKRATIKKFAASIGHPWSKLRRAGWRCVPAVVTWPAH
jgi:hypothetical protein